MDEPTLTILGATGYTGRLCAAEAVRRGVALRLAGRRPDALADLADELAAIGPRPAVAVADVVDRAALARLAATSDVVLSTVGPYARLGRPVVEAAIDAGCAYLDVSGEATFVEYVHHAGPRAATTGATLVPAVGFDGAVADLLAAVAARDLAGTVDEARAATVFRSGGVSAGTARSALGVMTSGGVAWIGGRAVAERPGAHRWRAPFPAPTGTRGAVSMPLVDAVLLGRSTGAPTARAYLAVPAATVVGGVAAPAHAVARRIAGTPLWSLVEHAVERLPEGPPPEVRRHGDAVVLAEVGGRGDRRRAWAHVRDPYGATAVLAIHYAARLLAGGRRPGAWTPSQSSDPAALLDDVAAAWGRA